MPDPIEGDGNVGHQFRPADPPSDDGQPDGEDDAPADLHHHPKPEEGGVTQSLDLPFTPAPGHGGQPGVTPQTHGDHQSSQPLRDMTDVLDRMMGALTATMEHQTAAFQHQENMERMRMQSAREVERDRAALLEAITSKLVIATRGAMAESRDSSADDHRQQQQHTEDHHQQQQHPQHHPAAQQQHSQYHPNPQQCRQPCCASATTQPHQGHQQQPPHSHKTRGGAHSSGPEAREGASPASWQNGAYISPRPLRPGQQPVGVDENGVPLYYNVPSPAPQDTDGAVPSLGKNVFPTTYPQNTYRNSNPFTNIFAPPRSSTPFNPATATREQLDEMRNAAQMLVDPLTGKRYRFQTSESELPKFHGMDRTATVEQFIVKVDRLLFTGMFPDCEVTGRMHVLFRDQARTWYDRLPEPTLLATVTWMQWKALLRKNFKNPDELSELQDEADRRVLTTNEDPIHYFLEKLTAVQAAWPGISDPDAARAILRGVPGLWKAHLGFDAETHSLDDLKMRMKLKKVLLPSCPWQDSEQRNPKYQVKKKQTGLAGGSKSPEAGTASSSGGSEAKRDRPCKHCGGDHWDNDCPDRHCDICSGKHWTNKCPFRREAAAAAANAKNTKSAASNESPSGDNSYRPNNKYYQAAQKAKAQEPATGANIVEISDPSPQESSVNTLTMDPDATITLDGAFDGDVIRIEADNPDFMYIPTITECTSGDSNWVHRVIVDPGAAPCVVDPDYLKRHFPGKAIHPTRPWQVKGLGSSQQALGVTTIPITFREGPEPVTFNVEFLVVEGSPDSLLLGNCALKRMKAVINLDANLLTVQKNDQSFSFQLTVLRSRAGKANSTVSAATDAGRPRNPKAPTRHLVLQEAYVIQPYSRAILPVRSSVGAFSQDFVLEPRPVWRGRRKLSAAATFNRAGSSWAYADVTNQSPFPFRLEKGTVMGSASLNVEASTAANTVDAEPSLSGRSAEFAGQDQDTNDGSEAEILLAELCDQVTFGSDLHPDLKERVKREVLAPRLSAFGLRGHVGRTDRATFSFQTTTETPVASRHYHLSPAKKKAVDDAMDDMLERGHCVECESPWCSPTHVVMKDGKPRVVIDYRGVNDVTVPDQYPLPHLDFDMLQQMAGAAYISVFDANRGFYQIPMDDESSYKLAFRNHRGLFRPTRMPFGAKNAPATFQRLIDTVLAMGRYKWCAAYIDDVIVFSRSFEDHLHHVSWVLDQFIQAGLTLSPAKTVLFTNTIDALGHTISDAGILIGQKNAKAILDQPLPANLPELERFIGLTGFYRKFLEDYARVVAPLIDLKNRTIKSGKKKLTWSPGAELAFEKIKAMVASRPMLAHPDYSKPFRLETDASLDGFGAVLSQADENGVMRPVCFLSRATIPAERNYSATDLECTAAAWALRKLRPIIEGCKIDLITDHAALLALVNYKGPNRRMSRESLELLSYGVDLTVYHKPGHKQVHVDQLSRCPMPISEDDRRLAEREARELLCLPIREVDSATCRPSMLSALAAMQPEDDATACQSLAAFSVWVTGHENDLLERIRVGLQDDPRYVKIVDKILAGHDLDRTIPSAEWPSVMKHPYSSHIIINGDLYYHSRARRSYALCVPDDDHLKTDILKRYHESPVAGHKGADKTYLSIADHYTWPGITRSVRLHVESCSACQRLKASNKIPPGLLKPLPIPSGRWDSISMDFCGPFPRSDGYDSILVVVCRLTKRTAFIPCESTDKAPTIASRMLDAVVKEHGLPTTIVSDRDPKFTSDFWATLCRMLGVRRMLCTSGHAQTDGMSEIMVRTLKQSLRFFVNRAQNNWRRQLSLLEIAVNNSVQASTGRTPFELDLGRAVPFQHPPIDIDRAVDPLGRDFYANLEATLREAQDHIQAAQDLQKRTYDAHHREVVYKKGQKVLLSTRAYRPSYMKMKKGKNGKKEARAVKIWPTYHGPFEIEDVPSSNTVTLKLYPRMQIHPRVNVEFVKPYFERPRKDGEQRIEAIIDDRIVERSRDNPSGTRLWLARFEGQEDGSEQWLSREEVKKYGGDSLIFAHDLISDAYDDRLQPHDVDDERPLVDEYRPPRYDPVRDQVWTIDAARAAIIQVGIAPARSYLPPPTSSLLLSH